MVWRADDPQGNEAGKVCWDVVQYTRGQGLDLGCGAHKAFPHFTGVDNLKDVELFGAQMRPDKVVDSCERLDGFEDASQDFVFSSHLLEHIDDYAGALKEWWRVIKTGGYLALYLPHKLYYPNVGQPGANPDHKHDFMPADIINAMQKIGGWNLIEREERNGGNEYSFFLVFRKRDDAQQRSEIEDRRKPKRSVCVVRYGGFGDMLQAANILPGLKRQGYHVTVMTTPSGKSVIKEDPNVDAWHLQDTDQVPNQCLTDFWSHMAKKFTKFINLSESVEGTLLAIRGRANHAWPEAVRRARLNENYLEFTSELAEVPYANEARFYPTKEERGAAMARLLDDDGFNVLWALSGSSCHKFYPGQDVVIARILVERPNCRIFLVGDATCKILEAGWEKEPRVVCLSGEQTIRETLALAQVVDCVIGPETGILNAVAFEQNRKVVLLSHSTVENLTKHWTNTRSIVPQRAKCYPCHRLHYTWEHCFQDEDSGASICQAELSPDSVFDAAVAEFKQ